LKIAARPESGKARASGIRAKGERKAEIPSFLSPFAFTLINAWAKDSGASKATAGKRICRNRRRRQKLFRVKVIPFQSKARVS
jgi:hypothetical protein